jgi:hypothetical protein
VDKVSCGVEKKMQRTFWIEGLQAKIYWERLCLWEVTINICLAAKNEMVKAWLM